MKCYDLETLINIKYADVNTCIHAELANQSNSWQAKPVPQALKGLFSLTGNSDVEETLTHTLPLLAPYSAPRHKLPIFRNFCSVCIRMTQHAPLYCARHFLQFFLSRDGSYAHKCGFLPVQLHHVIARGLIYLRTCPGCHGNALYIFLANTCERDSLTLAMASSSRMTQKTVVAGFVSIKIHHNPLIHSESMNSIPRAAKLMPSLITSPPSNWCSEAMLLHWRHGSQRQSPSTAWNRHDCGSGCRRARIFDVHDGASHARPNASYRSAAATVLLLRGSNHAVLDLWHKL